MSQRCIEMDDQKGKLRPLSSSGRKQTNFKKFTLPVLGEKHPFGSSARLVYDQHHHHQPQIPQFDGDTEYRHQHEHQHQRQPQYQPQYQQHHIDRKRTNSNGMYPSPSPSVPSQPTTQSYTIDNNNNNQNNYNKHNSNSNHSDSNNTNNSSNIKNNNLNNTSYTDVINSNDGNRNGNISQNANNNDSAQTQGGRNSHVGNHTSPSKFINQIRHGESLTQNSEYYQKTSPERYSHPLGASSPNHAHNEDGNNANGASDTNRIRSEHGNGRSGAPIKNNRNGFDNISDDAQARNHSRMVGETAKETRYPNPVYRNSSAAEKYYAQYPASPQSGKHVASAGYGFPSKQGIPLQDMRDMQLAGRDTERERDQDNHNHHHATGMRRRKASTRSDASVAGDDVQDKERDSSERTKALGRARTTNIMKVGHDKHGEYFYTMNNIRYRLHLTDHKSKTKSMANVTYNKRASQDFLDRRPDGT